jgi:hypothetical protein
MWLSLSQAGMAKITTSREHFAFRTQCICFTITKMDRNGASNPSVLPLVFGRRGTFFTLKSILLALSSYYPPPCLMPLVFTPNWALGWSTLSLWENTQATHPTAHAEPQVSKGCPWWGPSGQCWWDKGLRRESSGLEGPRGVHVGLARS